MNVLPPRVDYNADPLLEEHLDRDPIRQFGLWFQDAVSAGLPQPNQMALATATPDGMPSARMVLLKGFDESGFVFYTNYESRKGRELEVNPRACLVFYWYELNRQVRISGTVTRTSPQESRAYFETRPLDARAGAVASRQSSVLADRRLLEEAVEEVKSRNSNAGIALPDHWGGFRLSPQEMEFWQGRANRLHDRLSYIRQNTDWQIQRLFP